MGRSTRATFSMIAFALLFVTGACKGARFVPAVQPGPPGMQLIDLWSRASIVAVGSVGAGHQTGTTQIAKYQNESLTVYPCEAQFRPSALIKSDEEIGDRTLLWFSLFSTCGFGIKPDETLRSTEQVWFLRSEGAWLRPVIDPSAEFLELFQPFQPAAKDAGDLRRSLSRTLLDPQSVAQTERGFTQRFDNFFELSCELAGQALCLQMLSDLHERASPLIRGQICRFVALTYDQCRFSDCPQDPLSAESEDPSAEQLRGARRASELREVSEERINKALNSGNPSDRESILGRLQILSCNIDPRVRERAREATRRFFPKAEIPACLSCP